MKKAKEYAKEIVDTYIEKNEEAAIDMAGEIIKCLFQESSEIQNQRKIRNYGPMLAVLKEQHMKWLSICRHVNKEVHILPEKAFLEVIRETMTMIYPNLMEII